jgi:hypothetical protein
MGGITSLLNNAASGNSASWQSSLGAGISGTISFYFGGPVDTLGQYGAQAYMNFMADMGGAMVCTISGGSNCLNPKTLTMDILVSPLLPDMGSTTIKALVNTAYTEVTDVGSAKEQAAISKVTGSSPPSSQVLAANQEAYVVSTVSMAQTIDQATATVEAAVAAAATYDASVGMTYSGGGGGGRPMMMM